MLFFSTNNKPLQNGARHYIMNLKKNTGIVIIIN